KINQILAGKLLTLGEFALPDQLHWSIRQLAPQERIQTWMRLCLGDPARTLLFFNTRSETEKFANVLRRSGLEATFFHAGLAREEKLAILNRFRQGRITHLCATGAFGMGVDLPNLDRTFITQVPYSPVAFVQAIGRVARFQKRGEATLFWSEEDFRALYQRGREDTVFLDKLKDMRSFLDLRTRHDQTHWLKNHFL
ncbi:MAG: hypothetical protein EOP09_20385, partial [Proteobacteria bacterium]